MTDKISLILITGMPGVGKTTITKRLYTELIEKSIKCSGFYTEEVRSSNGERLGFDIINLDNNERKPLARSENVTGIRRPKVGKYSVYVQEFEDISLKIFKNIENSNNNCLIIDEIGKMELLSKKFEIEIRKLIEKIKNNNIKLIATIPNPNRNTLKIVEELLQLENGKLFNITKSNRNDIYNDIKKISFEMLKIK